MKKVNSKISNSKLEVVAGYARCSSEEQIKGTSIDVQIEAIQKYCEEEHLKLIQIIKDEGISGTKRDRPGILLLQDLVRRKEIDAIVFHKWDRFGRDAIDTAVWIDKFERQHGIKLISIAEPTGDDAAGELHRGIEIVVVAFESRRKGERIRDGFRKCREQGFFTGGVFYGYKSDNPGKKKPHWQIVLKKLCEYGYEADIIKEVYERSFKGETDRAIFKDLNSRGLRYRALTKNKKFAVKAKNLPGVYISFNSNHISQILRRVYDGSDDRPKIVDPYISAIVKDRCKKRQKKRGRPATAFIFTQLLKCGQCGSGLNVHGSKPRHGKEYRYFICNNRQKDGTCDLPAIPLNKLEDAILGTLQKDISAEAYHKIWNVAANELGESLETDALEYKRLKARLLEIDKVINFRMDFTNIVTGAPLQKLQSEVQDLEREKEMISSRIQTFNALSKMDKKSRRERIRMHTRLFQEKAKGFYELIDQKDVPTLQRLLQEVLDGPITVYAKQGKVRYKGQIKFGIDFRGNLSGKSYIDLGDLGEDLTSYEKGDTVKGAYGATHIQDVAYGAFGIYP